MLDDHDRLVGIIATLEETRLRLEAEVCTLQEQSDRLTNLYVASYRLHGSLDRAEVLETMREILINLIGSEEFAIFEEVEAGGAMSAVSSCGVDDGRLAPVRVGEGGLGLCIARGVPYVAGRDEGAGGLAVRACVPLRVGDRVIGAIVVYGLLAHKPALAESDVELFHLLSTHGATALYCSELYTRAGAGA